MADKKPGDLSHLGRTDPLERDASWLPLSSYGGTRTNKETEAINNRFRESQRREFRQSEDSLGSKYRAARTKKAERPLTADESEGGWMWAESQRKKEEKE